MSEKKSDPHLENARTWLTSVSRELGQDPAVIQALMEDPLDLTRDVAHGPSRPAAPLTAFLVGLATGRAMDTTTGSEAAVDKSRENIRQILNLLARSS